MPCAVVDESFGLAGLSPTNTTGPNTRMASQSRTAVTPATGPTPTRPANGNRPPTQPVRAIPSFRENRLLKNLRKTEPVPTKECARQHLRCPEEPLEFLGYRIGRNYRLMGEGAYLGTRPSKASVRAIRRKVSALTARRYGELIDYLPPKFDHSGTGTVRKSGTLCLDLSVAGSSHHLRMALQVSRSAWMSQRLFLPPSRSFSLRALSFPLRIQP